MILYAAQPETALRDSIALSKATDAESFSRIVAYIEARHAVEGISPASLDAWEAEKRRVSAQIARLLLG